MKSDLERISVWGCLILVGVIVVPPALEQWKLANVPTAVWETVESQFPTSEILSVDTPTRAGATTYEVHVQYLSKPAYVRITPGGRILGINRPSVDDSHEPSGFAQASLCHSPEGAARR